MQIQVHTRQEAEGLIAEDAHRFDQWAADSDAEFRNARALAAFYAANQRQFGYKPGRNSGHGKVEAVLPMKLVHLLDRVNPGWMDDDREWERFIKGEGRWFTT